MDMNGNGASADHHSPTSTTSPVSSASAPRSYPRKVSPVATGS